MTLGQAVQKACLRVVLLCFSALNTPVYLMSLDVARLRQASNDIDKSQGSNWLLLMMLSAAQP